MSFGNWYDVGVWGEDNTDAPARAARLRAQGLMRREERAQLQDRRPGHVGSHSVIQTIFLEMPGCLSLETCQRKPCQWQLI